MIRELEPLMERNLLEVFGQRDSERRAAAITELYTADCTFFEAEEGTAEPRAPGTPLGDCARRESAKNEEIATKRAIRSRPFSNRRFPCGGTLRLP